MEIIKLRINNTTVNVAIYSCVDLESKRKRSVKINKYKRFLSKLI